jgi:hypothetical protein
MAEGYIYDETIGFVTEYMQEFKHVRCRLWEAYEEEGVCGEVLKGAGIKFILPKECHDLAHIDVLTNTSCLAPWVM